VSKHDLSRRRFIGISAAAMVAASCGAQEGKRPSQGKKGEDDGGGASWGTGKPSSYKESPMLTDLVKAGELPPIKERLPREPLVVEPGLLVSNKYVEMQPGEYGGTLQLAQEAPSGDPVIFLGMDEQMTWAPNGFDFDEGIVGNVVKDYEANSDDTEFTFRMREGLKWSDGKPVTMEDVKFAFEDVLSNEEITPTFPLYLQANLRPNAAPAKLNVIDDWTFSLQFDRPYGAFPAQISIAGWRGYAGIIKPRHYLEQFHKKYADPKELKEKLKAESIPEDQWFNLFNAKQLTEWMWNVTNEQGLGHPTLTPWIMKKANSGVFTYERNPYYFKVDPNGNQLPYMDGIRSQTVQDKETLTARALMGEFDYLGERASLRQMPLIAEKAERGEVKMSVARMHRLPINFALNLTYDDDNWRKVVRDIRFRRALSLAMNRKEIIENFYLGEFARLPEETNPSEYNVDEANRLLDEMGLNKKDSDGFRLGPDGKRFRIPFEIQDLSEDHIPMGELMAEYWKNVGVFTTVKLIEGTLAGERTAANKIQATGIWAHHDIWGPAGFDDYLPHQNSWGQLWHEWFTSQGESGEEPIEEVKQLFDFHIDLMSAAPDSQEAQDALEAILKSYRDNIWSFNPVEHSYYPTFWTTRLKNVAEGIKEDVFGIVVNFSMEQWYIDE
jgi:peptide/nickel transport system substrate-binding protein